MEKAKLELLKEAVNYNEELLKKGKIEDLVMVMSKKYEQTIWNPFRDYADMVSVNPVKEYGEEFINKFIQRYKQTNYYKNTLQLKRHR